MNEFICEHGNPVRYNEPFTLDQCRVCWCNGDPERCGPGANVSAVFKPVTPLNAQDLSKGYDNVDKEMAILRCKLRNREVEQYKIRKNQKGSSNG